MSTFYLEIVTPERKFFEGQAEMIIVHTPDGEIGILKDHEPAVIAVDSGDIRFLVDGVWKEAAATPGFMEVTSEKTILLVDTAEWPEEIDINRAKAAKERAEERLQQKLAYLEYIRSQASLARALARLKVTNQIK
ncbi:MAG: ATP synthase F1 subunit epsilon [Deltaproteobacteria bacterium]